jgi:hypothetical protein
VPGRPEQRVSIPEAPEYEPGYSQAVRAGNTDTAGPVDLDAMIAVVD